MGVVHQTHVTVSGVETSFLRRMVAKHLERFTDAKSSRDRWSCVILSGLGDAAHDGMAAWGSEGKGLDDEVRAALLPFFRDLLAENPDATILFGDESDADDSDDGNVARWTAFYRVEREEQAEEAVVERRENIPCRILPFDPDDYESDDEDEDEDEDERDIDGAGAFPTWSMSAGRVSVLIWNFVDAAASSSSPGFVRECMATLKQAKPRAEWDWRTWGYVGEPVDVEPLIAALAESGSTGLVMHQSETDTMKVARIDDGAVTYQDVPFGLAWSPALAPLLPTIVELEPHPRPENVHSPAPADVSTSPHRSALLEAGLSANRIGLRSQPAFQTLLTLSPAERRHLLLDLCLNPPADGGWFIENIAYLLLEFSEVVEREPDVLELIAAESHLPSMASDSLISCVERFVVAHGWSPAIAQSVLVSTRIHRRAASAHSRPDRRQAKEVPFRALQLVQAAERIVGSRDVWIAAVERDLAALPDEQRVAWREAFAAWEARALPFPLHHALERDWPILQPLGDNAATAAHEWLARVNDSTLRTARSRDALEAKLRTIEGLMIVATKTPSVSGLGRTLLTMALKPSVGGGVSSPRLAYRAIDLLSANRDAVALHELASSPYRRIREYASRGDR